MIISKRHAQKLIKDGKARIEGMSYNPDSDQTYAVLSRSDKQRTDHYLMGDGDRRNSDLDDAA